MLTADAQLEVRLHRAAQFSGTLNELAYAPEIQGSKGIEVEDLLVIVAAQVGSSIVTAQTEGHLGQVVGTEGVEVSLGGDLISQQSSTGSFHHGADHVLQVAVVSLENSLGSSHDDALDVLELLEVGPYEPRLQ